MLLEEEQDGLEPTLALAEGERPGDSTKSREQASWPSGQGDLRPLELHDKVGPFEVVDFVGRGGMGQVYKARDTRLDRIVALKVLLPEPGASEERFQREARAQAQVDHEGVCRVYEVGASEGRAYIAMQFLGGTTLAKAMEELNLEEKVSVIHQVAEAVQAAHRQGLVHRDLKPGNIMVQRVHGEVKAWVLDFGMVQMAGDSRLTLTGEVVGTPLYMAPEQIEGAGTAIDRRTDIYSLGAILYELLTGRPPITGKNILEVLCRVSLEDPVPPRQRRPTVPEDLEWITLRCLEKEPKRRYASAGALIEDLERFRVGEPVNARQGTLRYHLSKKVRKYRGLLMVSGLILALLAGAFWRDLSQRRDAAEATRLTAKFLRQVEQIEWRKRLMATLPLHDMRAETEALLAELKTLEEEVEALGERAQGPGFFALGRGYHVLGELDLGLEYLERAWASGNRDPVLSFDLGLAYGEKYHERLYYSRRAADPEVQQQVEQDAKLRYKAPAVEHFQRAREKGTGDPAWAEALLATYEERSEAALVALNEAAALSPWRYEAHVLRSKIWHDRALQSSRQGHLEEASEQIDRAAQALEVARSLGESDSQIYAASCEINTTRVFALEDERFLSSDGRQALLEPCHQAIAADSGSAPALTTAASMANELAIQLLWIGDGEAKSFFERSVDWSQRATKLDPESILATDLLSRNYANLGFLSDSSPERDHFMDKALEQAQKAVEMAPADLGAALALVEILLTVASEASVIGEDVEPLYEEAATVLEPLVQQASPVESILTIHAAFEVERAAWYSVRGGDAESALARARASLAALDSNEIPSAFEAWTRVELCSAEAFLSFSKDEVTNGLAACRNLSAEEVRAAPDDLEWAVLDANLSMLWVEVEPTELEVLKPRIEEVLQHLRGSEVHLLAYDRFLGYWRLQLARSAEGEERSALLNEAIDAFSRSLGSLQDLETQLARVDARLQLAEIERRHGRLDSARILLEESRQGLAVVSALDAQRIRLQILQAVAGRIEVRLDISAGSQEAAGTITLVDAEVEWQVGWDALLNQPYLRSETRWWRTFLEGTGVEG